MAGTAWLVLAATVEALRNQYASRVSAAKFGYRPGSMFPSAVSRLFRGNSSNIANTIGGVRSIVWTDTTDSDGSKLCFTPGSARNNTGTTRTAGRSEEHTSELQSQSNLVCR